MGEMKLRALEERDAEQMLEWMHDPFVVRNMQTDFAGKTIEDCRRFIEASADTAHNLNLAVVDDKDEYMGTVSLKNISGDAAEFAITVRRSAMGKGYASFAMREIIGIAFEKYHLSMVYWCVDPENARAIRFYEKNGYKRWPVSNELVAGRYTEEQIKRFYWFRVINSWNRGEEGDGPGCSRNC
ncbi:MAG: GNAT family N-acetyltransferase [Lachnospiraceae bacterium]|nr:GNAT family N-acetyltransferase [Lachnospiraceae bacterium]